MPIRKSYLSTHCWELKLKHFETKTVIQKGSHKFLGVTVDQFFKRKENTEKLVSELRSLGYIFRKSVKYSDVKTIKTVYYGYVYRKLNYGILAWGHSTEENMDKIFKKQKSIIRIMQNADKNTSCREFFVSLKILTLPSIIILMNCLQVKQNI